MSTEHTDTQQTTPQQPNTSQPVMGPDQGQPHFSYTTPGDPYQGAPVAGNVQQPMQQPVYQQPMQQPVYQQPVYQQPMQQPVYQQPEQQATTVDPKTSEEQVKQFVDLVKDTAEGKADPASFLSFFNGIDDTFWKGLLVGAGLTFVCTSKTVRSIFTAGGGKEEMSAEEMERMEDLKAEQEYMAAQAAKEAAEKE